MQKRRGACSIVSVQDRFCAETFLNRHVEMQKPERGRHVQEGRNVEGHLLCGTIEGREALCIHRVRERASLQKRDHYVLGPALGLRVEG